MAVIGLHLSLFLNPGDVNHIRVLFFIQSKQSLQIFKQRDRGRTENSCLNGVFLNQLTQPFLVFSSLIQVTNPALI